MFKSNIKKILLIVPPITLTKNRANFNVNFPMGLGYIAAILERNFYEVTVLDTVIEKYDQETPVKNNKNLINVGMTFEEIRDFIVHNDPDCVGITSMFSFQANNAYGVASAVKSIDKNIPVILGGAHATADPHAVLKNKDVDFVVLGVCPSNNCTVFNGMV